MVANTTVLSASRAGIGSAAVTDASDGKTRVSAHSAVVSATAAPSTTAVWNADGVATVTWGSPGVWNADGVAAASWAARITSAVWNADGVGTAAWAATSVTFSVTLTQNLTTHLATSVGLLATLQQNFRLTDSRLPLMRYHYVLNNGVRIASTPVPSWHPVLVLIQGLAISQTMLQKFTWGRVLVQALHIHDAASVVAKYAAVLAQALKFSSAFTRVFPLQLQQNLSVHLQPLPTLALKLLQKLLISTSQTTGFNYHLALASQVIIKSVLARVIAPVLAQLFTVHPVLGRQFTTQGSLAQLLTVHPAFTNKLVLQIIGNLNVSPSQLVEMIYKGDPLLDGVIINALYVSPSGTTTTWAVNTRTNAVTEYMNYNFRSFALLGNRYIAAGSGGLYELEGDTDAGATIVSELMSGYLQLNEKKLFGIKGAYVAIRGGGRFYLKLISGDGREYTYELRAQPNLMTTKVKVGKGLRTTYMAFDLTTEGQDFDLDSIEFIPMTSGRRV